MPITIAGSGTITGISAGGLPDASVTADDLASNAVTTAKIADANITAAKLDGAQSGSAPIYGCRAWVNFDGTKDTTGATSTSNTNRLIRASGNVTSVLRNAAGDYTITFTTAMPDANYSAIGSCKYSSATNYHTVTLGDSSGGSNPTTTTCRLLTYANTTLQDCDYVCVAVFR